MDRLVLGCGTVGRSLVDRLSERPGSLVVLVGDERLAESLRDEGIDARDVDASEPTAVRAVVGGVDSVIVAPDGTDRVRELARTARAAYPDAFVMACLGDDATDDDASEVAEDADRVLDVAAETADYLLERAGDAGIRTRKLQGVIADVDGTLAVVAHDNPDPDVIASAVGLQRIAEAAGTDAEVCYYGEISHQENRALVNLLEFDLRNLEPDADLEEYGGFALVDHSRPGINDGLPTDTSIDVVIDHHPPRAPVEARFVDLRSDVGATSTLVTGYLQQLGVQPEPALATGLLYGIQVDTKDFRREVSMADFEAASGLIERADSDALQRIESPSVTAETLEVLARAISNRRVENGVLTTGVGRIGDRDALAQAADRLLEMEGVSTTLVFGYTDEMVYVSARSREDGLDLGEALRDAFGQIGSAGGHAEMAGAQIPVGILVEETDDADRDAVVHDVVTDRFFETLGIEPDREMAVVYPDFPGTDDSTE
jgi:nanoRNase/pAp phosphatase (c-di-AMP/oligoRNAs hydrolase)